MRILSALVILGLAALAVGCGGGKRRAEHARSSALPSGAAAPTAASPPASQRCQVSGFAYAVPGPGPITAAGAP